MSARLTGIGDRGGGHGGKGGTGGWLELRGAVGEASGSEGGRVVSSDEAGVGLYIRGKAVRARVPPWTRVRRRGRVCLRQSSNGDEGEVDEGHGDERGSGTREGRSHGAINALSALCARGHALFLDGDGSPGKQTEGARAPEGRRRLGEAARHG